MRLYSLLKSLSRKRTIDILCEALMMLIKYNVSEIEVLKKVYSETLDGGSELDEKREMLMEQQETLRGLLKYTNDFFKEGLDCEDFELMDMEVPDYLFAIETLEKDDIEDEEDSEHGKLIEVDFSKRR